MAEAYLQEYKTGSLPEGSVLLGRANFMTVPDPKKPHSSELQYIHPHTNEIAKKCPMTTTGHFTSCTDVDNGYFSHGVSGNALSFHQDGVGAAQKGNTHYEFVRNYNQNFKSPICVIVVHSWYTFVPADQAVPHGGEFRFCSAVPL
jgi:hypothetical protein